MRLLLPTQFLPVQQQTFASLLVYPGALNIVSLLSTCYIAQEISPLFLVREDGVWADRILVREGGVWADRILVREGGVWADRILVREGGVWADRIFTLCTRPCSKYVSGTFCAKQ